MTYSKAYARATDLFTVLKDNTSHIIIIICLDESHPFLVQDFKPKLSDLPSHQRTGIAIELSGQNPFVAVDEFHTPKVL